MVFVYMVGDHCQNTSRYKGLCNQTTRTVVRLHKNPGGNFQGNADPLVFVCIHYSSDPQVKLRI